MPLCVSGSEGHPKVRLYFHSGRGSNSASETQKAWKSYFSKHLGSQLLLKSFYVTASCLESRNEVNLVCPAQLGWKPLGRGTVSNHMLVQCLTQWGPDFSRSLQGQWQYKQQWYEVKEEILTQSQNCKVKVILHDRDPSVSLFCRNIVAVVSRSALLGHGPRDQHPTCLPPCMRLPGDDFCPRASPPCM